MKLHASASDDVIDSLAKLNREYEEKYSHIFILCAKGKPATEVLSSMQQR
jgi:2-oxo-4-hydroxy-4-carboxy-5-ureidoimidazoline decarboxylase